MKGSLVGLWAVYESRIASAVVWLFKRNVIWSYTEQLRVEEIMSTSILPPSED